MPNNPLHPQFPAPTTPRTTILARTTINTMTPFRKRAASPTRIEFLNTPPTSPSPPPNEPQANETAPLAINMDELDRPALTALLEREAATGVRGAHAVLQTALESKAVATATADALSAQTAQLERVAGDVGTARAHVARAERVVEKLSKSKLRRAAERPLTALSSLEDSAKRRVRAIVPSTRGASKGDAPAGRDAKLLMASEDDYADFESETVRNNLRKQDQYLDEAAVQVDELRDLAVRIQEELEYEAEIVDGIDAPELSSRIRETNKKIRRRLLS